MAMQIFFALSIEKIVSPKMPVILIHLLISDVPERCIKIGCRRPNINFCGFCFFVPSELHEFPKLHSILGQLGQSSVPQHVRTGVTDACFFCYIFNNLLDAPICESLVAG